MMVMVVLVTGFEPFGGAEMNPSWEAVQRLPERVAGHEICKQRLPVVFGAAGEMLLREVERIRPDVVIACGVAGGRKAITPELTAINYRLARIPDNAGQQFSYVPIDPAGDAAYITPLPVQHMVEALQAAGIPAYLSLSAGAYVCNDVYYALLRHHPRGLFVHVPDGDAMDADTASRALALIIEKGIAVG